MPWHRKSWAGAALRLAGALLLGVACLAGHALFGQGPIGAPGARDAALALVLFATATSGSAIVVLGAHLFDEVDLPARWARRF